jgi:protein required for attachment to host cells
MPIPNQALILVADGRKTLFLRNHGDAAQLDLRTEDHDERDDRKDRELKSDAPGLSGQSFGFGRPALDEPGYHQQAEDRWAKDTADLLNKRALAGDYEALAIVAPPKTLGELRKHLHKEVEKRLVATFNKEMTDRPLADIEDLLAGEAAPPA